MTGFVKQHSAFNAASKRWAALMEGASWAAGRSGTCGTCGKCDLGTRTARLQTAALTSTAALAEQHIDGGPVQVLGRRAAPHTHQRVVCQQDVVSAPHLWGARGRVANEANTREAARCTASADCCRHGIQNNTSRLHKEALLLSGLAEAGATACEQEAQPSLTPRPAPHTS